MFSDHQFKINGLLVGVTLFVSWCRFKCLGSCCGCADVLDNVLLLIPLIFVVMAEDDVFCFLFGVDVGCWDCCWWY